MQQTLTIHLPAARVAHVFGREVAQAPAEIVFGLYPGDTAGPFKITIKPALSQFYELSFTPGEQASIERYMRAMRQSRGKIPHNISDSEAN
jgi:hypothetical protein